MDINTIVDIAIKLVGTCIVMVISKTCIPWLKEQSTYSTVKKFVQAAEKLASAGKIQKADKKAYVLQLLSSSGIKVTAEVEGNGRIRCGGTGLDDLRDYQRNPVRQQR